MNYRTKTHKVDAIRFTDDNAAQIIAWAALKPSADKGRSEVTENGVAGSGTHNVQFRFPDTGISGFYVMPGEWVYRPENGMINTDTDEAFRARFEAI